MDEDKPELPTQMEIDDLGNWVSYLHSGKHIGPM